MSNTQRPARREDWKTQPMPAETAPLPVHISLTADEMQAVAQGHIPDSMDDKWFIYLDHEGLWFHRSWTGILIYHATLERDDAGGGTITSAVVNRNREQYQWTNDAEDARLMTFLVERVLLGRNVTFPVPDAAASVAGIYQHHIVGSSRRK